MNIPFNKPYLVGNEQDYINQAILTGHLSGGGEYTRLCELFIEENLSVKKTLLTPSCTAALEMAAMLLDLRPGDEVIMPSYTFVTTASSFVLRGATPIFVDIRFDTLNIDETKIEAAITSKTKAIVVVHYAGVACEMDSIMRIAEAHGLIVVEDAAQALGSTFNKKPLGSIGHLGTISFHATKNIICGEAGALCINDERFIDRAQIIRDKGTNRQKFINGEVDKYTWIDIGSSYLTNEITAAFLYAQLEKMIEITTKRLEIWNSYHLSFERITNFVRPTVPGFCNHNAHIYYLLLENEQVRNNFIWRMRELGIQCTTHYVPLHTSTYGSKVGRVHGDLPITIDISNRIVRLPLYPDVYENLQYIISKVITSIAVDNKIEKIYEI